jgi:hypothetical protein
MTAAAIAAAAASLIALSSCKSRLGGGGRPVGRIGCLPAWIGTSYPDPNDLGIHSRSEKNGIVYTCRTGPIDLAHLRKAADWARYFAQTSFDYLMQGKTHFSFRLVASSKYFVDLTYPEGWGSMPEETENRIAREVAVDLGRYFAYVGTTWHEIITWFGYKSTLVFPETQSAFTWEDQFSNLLGTCIAGKALENSGSFDKEIFKIEMTSALYEELEMLDVQPPEVARDACKEIGLKTRHVDIGLTGEVTPFVVQEVEQCQAREAQPYPAPSADMFAEHGFSVCLEIAPRVAGGGRILKIAHPEGKGKRVDPEVHFELIMEQIKKEAIERWGPNSVDPY